MASLFGVLLKIFRILRSAKDHITRFPRHWALLLAYLSCKLSEWRCPWPSKSGTFRNCKPVDPSFPGSRASSYSVSGGSVCLSGFAVAASTVPPSANWPGRDHARPQSATDPASPTLVIHSAEPQSSTAPASPTLVIHSADPSQPPTLYPTGHLVASLAANRSSGNLSTQSRASERLLMITNTRPSSRASVRNDRLPQDPKATYHQFGPGPASSRSRERPSRSPSPIPQHLGVRTPTHADGRISPTSSFRSPMDFPSSTSRIQGHLGPPAIRRERQGTTSIDLSVQGPSAASMPLDTLTCLSPHISPVDQFETSSQRSRAAFSTASDFLTEGRIIKPIHSDQIPRYTKNIRIPREGQPYWVKPLTTTFPYFPEPTESDYAPRRQDCSPWIPATHPDGALYFYDPERRLFTDSDMHDSLFKEEMEDFYSHLRKIVDDNGLTISPESSDLVLDIKQVEDNKMKCSYYYACHDTRCLFWLESYDATHITYDLDGFGSPAHLKHRLEAFYWNHWSLFPVVFKGRSLPSRVYDELIGILTHGCIDVMTSKLSTLPYNDDKMQKMIGLVQNAKQAQGSVGDAGDMEYYIAATTRLLSFFSHWRFLYFHGQRSARLVCDVTIYDTNKHERSALVSVLSLWLFFAPEVHLMELDKVWTDGVIIERAWKSFMDKLLNEWNDLILWSTVMLAVDVGFLAIPGVVPYNLVNGVLTITRHVIILASISQIATVISLGASVGSIVISLLLMRHNRTKQEAEPREAYDYLSKTSRSYIGLELMAIVFSLPWALLMWSMLMFFIALFCYCWSISSLKARICIALIAGMLFAFFLACLWTIWETTDKWGVWLDGFQQSIIRALQYYRTFHGRVERLRSLALRAVERFRNRPSSHVPGDGGDVQPSTGPQSGVDGV